MRRNQKSEEIIKRKACERYNLAFKNSKEIE